jgi:hypothetical protein
MFVVSSVGLPEGLSPNSSIITGCSYILEGGSHMKISIRQLKALIRESVMEKMSEPMHGGSDEEKERIAAMIQDELKKFLADKRDTDMKAFQDKINRGFESLMPVNEARKLRSMIRATIRNTTRR